ncbi:MAG: WD40 repeat domain-containing protein [Calditrichia bacterium]
MNAQENAGAPETEHSIKISQWLKTEPFSAPVPALAGDDFKLSQMLGFEPVDIATITNDQMGLSWSELAADESGNAQLSGSGDQPQVIWLAAYLETDRFAKATLKLQTAHLARVYLDGQKIAEKSSSENEEPGKIEEKLTLETGKHVLVVKSLRDPKNESKWQLSGSISTTSDAVITVSTSPKKIVDAHQLLDRTMIRGVSISADGKIAAVSYSKMNPATAKSESWLELIDVNTSQNIRTYQGGTAIGGIQWAPKSNLFAYEESNDGKSTVWIVNLPNGTVTPILRDVENFGYFQWSPDEQFMIYSITDEAEKKRYGTEAAPKPARSLVFFRNNSFL